MQERQESSRSPRGDVLSPLPVHLSASATLFIRLVCSESLKNYDLKESALSANQMLQRLRTERGVEALNISV